MLKTRGWNKDVIVVGCLLAAAPYLSGHVIVTGRQSSKVSCIYGGRKRIQGKFGFYYKHAMILLGFVVT